jgi:hypothetical protein
MSNGASSRCNCPRCTIRSLMWPAVVITVGMLFLLQELRGGSFDFGNTYPFILIVAGAILLASALVPMTGHIDSTPVPPAPPAPGPMPGTSPGSMSGPGR